MAAFHSAKTTEEVLVSSSNEPARQTPRGAYQAPELHELGTLEKLQRYGFYYNDGKRYKDDY